MPVDWNKPGRLEDFYPGLPGLELRLARRAGDDAQRRCDLLLPDGRSRSARALDLRPRHAAGRRRPSHVSAGRQRRRAGDHRRRHAGAAARRASPTPRRRSRPTKPRGCRRPAASCCRTARRRRTSSSTRWSSAPAASASTGSKTSSARTSCGRSSSAIRRSPAIMFNRSDVHRGESWQIPLPSLKLTSDGAMKLLNAAMAKAKEMGVPQCISIVDSGGHLLAFAPHGRRLLAIRSTPR